MLKAALLSRTRLLYSKKRKGAPRLPVHFVLYCCIWGACKQTLKALDLPGSETGFCAGLVSRVWLFS